MADSLLHNRPVYRSSKLNNFGKCFETKIPLNKMRQRYRMQGNELEDTADKLVAFSTLIVFRTFRL